MRAILISLVALAACSQPASGPPAEAPSTPVLSPGGAIVAEGCAITAQSNWTPGRAHLSIEATLHGPTCGKAAALIVIRDAQGLALYADGTVLLGNTLAFNPNADDETMTRDLAAWLTNQGPGATAETLPAWAPDAPAPAAIFLPTVGRETYEAARTAKWPLFCYPTGPEIAACVGYDAPHGVVQKLGFHRPEAAR